jgi:hypothetical protein
MHEEDEHDFEKLYRDAQAWRKAHHFTRRVYLFFGNQPSQDTEHTEFDRTFLILLSLCPLWLFLLF